MTDVTSTFEQLGLRKELVDTLVQLGYEAPTPIQERTIPVLLGGSDLIGQAQTGTGKTAAFALPILQKVDTAVRKPQALVLTPTRELAMQVADAIHTYSKLLDAVSVLPIYGGAPIVPQLKRLDRGVHVVVGTPGRVIDHLDRGSLDLSSIRMFVLDEADEMLRMGFIEDVEKILAAAPEGRQVALFSATMPDEIARIAKRYMADAERVEIERKSINAPQIEQRFLNLSENQKLTALTQLLELEPSEAAIVFRRTKNGAAELAEKLEGRGFTALALHGDMTQAMRENVIRRLRSGQADIVVATDVAARGLDVEQIEHVINYDIPYDVEAYVHRIGRTGRAGRSGVATLFITPRERRMMREIERYTGTQIKPMKMPTRADVAARRVSLFKDSIRQTITAGELEMYLELVEQLVDEGPFEIADVAAAAVRLATLDKSLDMTASKESERAAAMPDTPQQPSAPSPSREERPRERTTFQRAAKAFSEGMERRPRREEETERRPRRDEEGERRPPRRDEGAKAHISIGIGKRDGIRPADIVGSIANEAGVPGREIGPIEIRDDVTIVGVPQEHAEKIVEKTARAMFRGKRLNVRIVDDEAVRPPRSFDRDRPRSSTGPVRPFGRKRDEDEAPRPRREFAPSREGRPAGRFDRSEERPRREGTGYSGAARRTFEARNDRARGATGDRPSRAGAGDRPARPSSYSRTRDDERPRRPEGGTKSFGRRFEGSSSEARYGRTGGKSAAPRATRESSGGRGGTKPAPFRGPKSGSKGKKRF